MNHSQAFDLGYKFARLGYPSTYTGKQEYADSFYKGHETGKGEEL